jgi:hypothetical protein
VLKVPGLSVLSVASIKEPNRPQELHHAHAFRGIAKTPVRRNGVGALLKELAKCYQRGQFTHVSIKLNEQISQLCIKIGQEAGKQLRRPPLHLGFEHE